MPLQHELREAVTLTVAQIIDLAQMAGLKIEGKPTDTDELESEVTIERCSRGVDDDGTTRHYRHIAYFEEYPEEGVAPLGSEVSPAKTRTKGTNL